MNGNVIYVVLKRFSIKNRILAQTEPNPYSHCMTPLRFCTEVGVFRLWNFHRFWVYSDGCSLRIKSAVTLWPRSNQTQPSSVFSWLFWPCQVLLQSGSLSSRMEVDMIAFKQPLLASDTQLQPGTSSDSKSTMMDCLAKTADQRRSKFGCVSGCARRVQSPEMAFPSNIRAHGWIFIPLIAAWLSCRSNYVINYWEFIRI